MVGRRHLMALSGILPLLSSRREFLFVSDHLERGDRPWVTGPNGAAKALVLAGLIARLAERAPAWLILTIGRDQAERLADDLAAFLPASAGRVHLLAPWESFNPEDPPSAETEGTRQRILEALRRGRPQAIIVASVAGAVHTVSDPRWIDTVRVDLAPGAPNDLGQVVQRLAGAGYDRTDLVRRPGELAVRGGLIDVYPSTEDHPIRIEWAGDQSESLRAFDPETQRTVGALPQVTILPARPGEKATATLLDQVPDAVCALDEPEEFERQAKALYEQAAGAQRRAVEAGRAPADSSVPAVPWDRIARALDAHRAVALSTLHRPPRGPVVEFSFGVLESFAGQTAALAVRLREWTAEGRRVVVASRQAHRMVELLAGHGVVAGLVERLDEPPPAGTVYAVPQALTGGLTADDLVVGSDAEILGWPRRRH